METTTNRFEQHSKLTLFIFCLICILILDFTAGAIFLRRTNDVVMRISDPYYHHGLLPNYQELHTWNIPYMIYTNNLGFKDAQIRNVPLQTNKHRILFIGDSFTEGIGVPYEESFVGLIDKQLSPKGYDILNAGVASYSPRLYYLKVKRLLELGLKTDELVVFIDLSDVQNELEYSAWTPSTEYSLRSIWEKYSHKVDHFLENRSEIYLHGVRPLLFGVTTQRIRDAFFGKTQTYNSDKQNKYIADIARWPFDSEVYEDWGRKGVAYEVNYMDMLYDLCKKYGIKMSIGVYPWPDNIEANDTTSRQVSVWKNFVQGKDIQFYNFFPTFISPSMNIEKTIATYFIYRDKHWNAEGHKLIAEKWLGQYLLNKN